MLSICTKGRGRAKGIIDVNDYCGGGGRGAIDASDYGGDDGRGVR
jgi:hypothetical protein